MEESKAADALGALAHPTRLRLFRTLVASGDAGLPAGMLAERLAVAPSTLSHHLAVLEHAGLIGHTRRQRNLVYSIDQPMVRALLSFLVEDCCDGRPELCGLSASSPRAGGLASA